jgi:hypothetical protein
MIFGNTFAEKRPKKLAFLPQNKAKLYKILIITLVFKKNAIFCQKLSKIAENCDHNIDPRLAVSTNTEAIYAAENDDDVGLRQKYAFFLRKL